jgi:uncharacterized membrane protein
MTSDDTVKDLAQRLLENDYENIPLRERQVIEKIARKVAVARDTLFLLKAFDPYPYILLNLFLSMLASVQAPIIMMSQNRHAAKDRIDAAHDYEVNLKAEIEIMALHEKLDDMRNKELAELMQQLSQRK